MKDLNPLRLCALTITFSSALAAAVQTPPTCCQPAPWRRFTNQLVSYIWGEEQTHRKCDYRRGTQNGRTDSSSPQNAFLNARYGQDMVLRFNVSTVEETTAIAEAAEDLYLDIWECSDNWVDIRLAKDILPSFLGLLPTSLQSSHAPLIPDTALVELISGTLSTVDAAPFSSDLRSSSKDVFFSDYQPLSVIEPWMRLLSSLFSTHVSIISVGKSHEGRDISAFKVGVHPTNNAKPSGPRKTIIIMGGLHAREWISVSSVNYIANQIISSYGKSKLTTKLLENFDFILIPTLNPDGYAYTWETDRLWRKNRQPTQLRFCNGIDIDRSFGFEWDGDSKPGNPCSESFAGDEAWQATEAKEFAAWAKNETGKNNVEFVALLDLHSYSQQVLYPYSFSCKAAPPTLEDLEELALGLAKSMRVVNHGHSYRARSACEGNVYLTDDIKSSDESRSLLRVELGGGSALDWLYHELKIPYAYQIKLRDMGSYGFLLPKQNIVPQGKELMGAVDYLGKFLLGEIGIAEYDQSRQEDQVLLTKPILDESADRADLQLEL